MTHRPRVLRDSMAAMFAEIAQAATDEAQRDGSFWADCARAVSWVNQPLDPRDRSYLGGRLNLCFNALDRPVIHGDADRSALVTPRVTWSVAQLLDYTARAAGILVAGGVAVGDGVLLALPHNEHLATAVLACSRVGARPVLASPNGPADSVALAVVAASQAARARAAIDALEGAPAHVLVIQDLGTAAQFADTDLDWATAMRPDGVGAAGCASLPSQALTAGREPNGLMTGFATAVLQWAAPVVLQIEADSEWPMPEVASDIDLAVAVHAPLLAGAALRMR